MQYKLEKLDGSVKVMFEVNKQDWDNVNRLAYEKTKDKYSLPGFRKGKVPMKMLQKSYGESLFFDDAFDILFPECYSEFLDKEPEVFPVDRPAISFDDINEEGIKFSATVTVRPEVSIGKYKGLKLTKSKHAVESKDIDAEVEKARERASRKVEISDRALKKGDIAGLDYSGSVDGVLFEGGTASNQELEIGSNQFIPGFEDQMIGMKIGEDRAVKVKFPEDYHATELKGKDAVFMVKLNKISVKELPEVNDEFVKEVSKFNTLAEYRADIEERLTNAAKKREVTEDENVVLKAIVDDTKVNIPECMIEQQLDRLIKDFEYKLMYQGMKVEDYYKYTNSTPDDLRSQRKPEAEAAVRTRLAVEEIIKAEKIEATDADVDAKIDELGKDSKKSREEFRKNFDEQRLDYMKNEILMDKLVDFLFKNNEWTEGSADETAKTAKPKKETPAAEKKAKTDNQ